MIPNRGQIKASALGLLDDDIGRIFTETVFATAFEQAYGDLYQGLLTGQVPAIENIVVVQLNPNTTSLTPATAGVADFADYVKLRERLSGSAELWRRMEPREQLTQRAPADRLLEFVWRLDTFYFIGATTLRDVEITYESSGTAPTDDSTAIGVDGCLNVMANLCAGIMGPRKGRDEIAQRCMNFAVGPKYDQGTMGGAMFRLIQAKVRSEQKTQIAPRPFTVQQRRGWRQGPFIAAQQPAGVGTAPAQFSSATGTITGTINGVNATFFLSYPVATANVYRNGDRLTQTIDVVFGANMLVFSPAQIPIPGDVITVDGWL